MADLFDELDVFDEVDTGESFVSGMAQGAKRAAGAVLGAFNAPLAAVWGALSPPENEFEQAEYDKASIPEQLAIRTGAAFESAKESIAKEGSFGKGYGQYYKGVTGKEVSPWAELGVNVISDPLVVQGLARGLGRGGFETLRQLRDYLKTGVTPIPVETSEMAAKTWPKMVDDFTVTDKQTEAQNIIDILKQRKAKVGAAETDREAGQFGSLLEGMPPRERPPLSALDQALNQPEKIIATGAGDIDTALRIGDAELDAFRAAQMAEAGELKPVTARLGGTPVIETPTGMTPSIETLSEGKKAADLGIGTAGQTRRYDEPFGSGVRIKPPTEGKGVSRGNLAAATKSYENGDFVRWETKDRIEFELNPPNISANPTPYWEAGIRHKGWAQEAKKFGTKEESLTWLDNYDLSKINKESWGPGEQFFREMFGKGWEPQVKIAPDNAKVKAAIADARKNGMSNEFRALFGGIDPKVAGTTPEAVRALAKKLDVEYRTPIEMATAESRPVRTDQIGDQFKARETAREIVPQPTTEIDAFTASMNPMQTAKAKAALEKNLVFDGDLLSRKDGIERAVNNGAIVVAAKEGRRLQKPSGAFLAEKDISKTGMDYAEYLNNQVTKQTSLPDLKPPELGKPPIEGKGAGLKSVGGGALGFEEDEQGNITYDAKKGILGMAGGVAFTKLFKGKALQKELATEPELAKVFNSIVKDKPSFSLAGIIPKINEMVFNRFSPIKDVSYKTYEKALTYSSHKDVAWMKFQELQDTLKPVRGAEDLMTGYVAARRMATRGARAIDNPGGVTFQEAQKAVERAEALYAKRGGNIEDMRAAADGFNEWTRKYILQEARDSGVLSKEAYEQILKDNDFYATFKILEKLPDDINKVIPTTGEYFSVGQQGVIKAMKGTERQMADPIMATIEKFVQAQSVFERNKVASSLIDDPATKGLLRPVATSEKQFAIMKSQGLNPVMEGTWSVRDFDTINRFKDGRVEKYLAPTSISEAMKRLTPFQAPRAIQVANDVFRKSATTLYLPFTISNMMRDALMAYNTSPVYTGGINALESAGKFAKDWGKGLKEGFMHEFFGKSDIVKEYLKAGGGFGYSGEVRNAKLAKDALFRSNVDIVRDQASLFKIIEKITGTVELAPRIGVYSRAQKDFGASAAEAAKVARSSTIDFSKGGVLTKSLNQFVPFINARVQGWNNVRLALQKNPVETGTKLFTSVVMPGIAAYAYNRHYYSDLYDDIPKYVKDNYFTFITGTDIDKDGKTVPKYFVIPKGDVGQLIMNPIEYALDQAMSKNKDSVAKFAMNWVSDLSPVPIAREGELSGTKALGSVTPPIVKGVVEDLFNKNMFTGRDVVPFNLKDKPADLQFKENTPTTYKWLGEKANISPLRIQNFMQNLFAGYGREGLDPSAMAKGLTGRFVKTQGGEKESQAWNVVSEIDAGYKNVRARAQSLIKKGNDDEAMAIMGAWNDGLVGNVDKIEKFGFEDKGGLYKQYIFSRDKMRNILSGKELEKGIENKLARKKTYTYR